MQTTQSFRTHRLENLLHLSGQEERVQRKYLAAWAQVAGWDPVQRYRAVGSATRASVKPMLDAVQLLLRVL